MADEEPPRITRRQLLKGAGLAGAAAVFPSPLLAVPADDPTGAPAQPPPSADPASAAAAPPRRRRVYENLTAEEAEVLEAMIDRLVPSDEHGPGGMEMGALDYIDRGLGGGIASTREDYRDGLAAMDRYCRMSRGAPFLALSPVDKDSVLLDLQTGSATGSGAGFPASSAAFFGMIKNHVWQGCFGDPFYGGNAGYAGWDLIGYPGLRIAVNATDQRRLEEGQLPVVRRSAYEWEMFEKATTHHGRTGDTTHGD
jgi:gluconate 2-dehydrogenase gamma chain